MRQFDWIPRLAGVCWHNVRIVLIRGYGGIHKLGASISAHKRSLNPELWTGMDRRILEKICGMGGTDYVPRRGTPSVKILLFRIVLPDPVLKYFSNSLASTSVPTAT